MRPEVRSRIEELLKPLSKISKTWHEHISQNLDEYLSYLEELAEEEDMHINFVQAGVMIDNMARVYAMNVEILFNYMTEILEMMRTNKKNSKSGGDEGGESSKSAEEIIKKRKKKTMDDDFTEFVPNVVDPNLKSTEQNQSVKDLPMHLQIFERSDWKRRKRPYHVFDMEKDTLDLADYRVMYQTSRGSKLQHNMLKELIEDNNEEEHSMQEMVIVLEAIVNEFGHLSVDDSDDNSNTPSIAETVEIGSTESQSLELLPVTPPPSPLTVKRSASATIEGPHVKRSMSEAEFEKACDAPLHRNDFWWDKVVTTTVNSEDPWNAVPIDGGMREKVLNKQMTYIVPTVLRPLSDSQQSENSERRRRSSVDGRPSVMIDYVDANMFRVFVKSRRFPVRPEMVKYYVQECRKKKTIIKEHSTIRLSLQVDLETLHNQLSQDIMSDFRGFEDFEADVGEEDGFRGFLDAVDSVVTIDATTALQNNDDWSDGAEAVAGSAAAESIRDVVAEVVAETGPVESTQDAMLDDNLIPSLEERCSTPECPSVDEQPCCSHDISRSGMSNTESDDAIHQRVERVKEWERFIRPNLKRAHERGYFDIHAIGSEILEAFPECNTSLPTVTFHQLTADKPKEDIARYFLATLQLANTYNVKISKSVPGVLSMDCMQLTLLSSSRHHEALEEYEAPSKSERRKRRIHTSNDSDSDDSVSESDNECDHRSSRNKRKRTKRTYNMTMAGKSASVLTGNVNFITILCLMKICDILYLQVFTHLNGL